MSKTLLLITPIMISIPTHLSISEVMKEIGLKDAFLIMETLNMLLLQMVPHEDAVNLSISSSIDNDAYRRAKNVSVVSDDSQFGGLNINSHGSAGMGLSVSMGHFILQKGCLTVVAGGDDGGCLAVTDGLFGKWGDSGVVADNNQHNDNSTDTEGRNQFNRVRHETLLVSESTEQFKGITEGQNSFIQLLFHSFHDQAWHLEEFLSTFSHLFQALRRLAQNREAARRNRQRKKAYVQQLENCNLRISQIQPELQNAQNQVIFGISEDQGHSSHGNGDLAFDMDYAPWFDEHQRLTYGLRSAVNSHASDTQLRLLIDGVMSHYDELFMLKKVGAKRDVFHILSGMWKTPAERCFMWLGGFRSSDLLKIIGQQIKPLIEQQFVDICHLQQCCQEAEHALSQGMEALQQSVVETLISHSLDPCTSAKIADYMDQMAIAMTKLASLEDFLHQADLLRQQTLHQLLRILTTRQAARALIVISDYKSRFQALNSLWLARPKE